MRRLRIVIAVAVIALVAAGVGTYVVGGRAVAAGDLQAAEGSLGKAWVHESTFDSLLNAPSFPPAQGFAYWNLTNADETRARDDWNRIVGKYQHVEAEAGADIDRLGQTARDLVAERSGPFVTFQRTQLEREWARVNLIIDASTIARRSFQIGEAHARLMAALYDSYAAFDPVWVLAQGGSEPGPIVAAFGPVEAASQRALALAHGPDAAPQLRSLIEGWVSYTSDFKHFFQALAAGDSFHAEPLYGRLVGPDFQADQFDLKTFDTAENALFQPYQDRYDAAWKSVGLPAAGG